ncbi:MAG: pyridoxine 5'-phosphate synthase [Bdellovibrionaceae bacterium]|nr:pyridoxine 5'-phosphate synthase [Pseudobdellovibrionaceae bacterium]
MTKLSVNINKIATLRNARGGDVPNVVDAAKSIQKFGAHGITVHPRPDERHITRKDVFDLRPVVHTEFNIEGYPSKDFLELILKVEPQQVTLVPDPPEVLTSNAGWIVNSNKALLEQTADQLRNFRASVFVEPETCSLEDLKFLKSVGIARVEMYTEDFAKAFETADHKTINAALERYKRLYNDALDAGLDLNAGHDLSQRNLACFCENFPHVSEVSIGHALISEALYDGLETTIKNYLYILRA